MPSQYESTSEEILQAVRENSIQRGLFILKNLANLNIDSILARVETLANEHDLEEWREKAEELSIQEEALNILDAQAIPIPYPLYFCTPEILVQDPQLTLYYRNVAMISNKVMGNIGLETVSHELGNPLGLTKARKLTQHFNTIISSLVSSERLLGPKRHLEMAFSNLGASFDGGWRNEVGRIAYMTVLTPLIRYMAENNRIHSIVYKLKGRILTDDDTEISASSGYQLRTLHEMTLDEIDHFLLKLQEARVVYRQINMLNGNRVLLNRQITWTPQGSETPKMKIGPDLLTYVENGEVEYPWAAELKGGADPAGSDEHWKTATRAFLRIVQAADATGKPRPMLTFIATILVGRVADEAEAMLKEGILSSIHNLTKIANDPQRHQQFLEQMLYYFETNTIES